MAIGSLAVFSLFFTHFHDFAGMQGGVSHGEVGQLLLSLNPVFLSEPQGYRTTAGF